MSLKSITAAFAVSTALASAPAHAAVVFSDNFDADGTTSALNFNGLINWTVGNGSIDYIRNGDFGINCNGGCLDMDGSTGDAGRITSRQVFTFDPGVNYFIDLTLSGNQRVGTSDLVNFGLVDANTGALFGTATGSIAAGSPFAVYTGIFNGSSAPGSWRLYVEGVGGDNAGAILDNYVLRDSRAAVVPEPATLLLAGLALAGMGALRRRR